ncbi:MAG: hypothetical protein ACI9WU_000450 [Myxococcota bacterium]|jgi:hypothetical protein
MKALLLYCVLFSALVAGCASDDEADPALLVFGGDVVSQDAVAPTPDPGSPLPDGAPVDVPVADEDALIPCIDTCPVGMQCVQIGGVDELYVCVPAHDFLCRPCSVDADCNQAGPIQSRCLSYGNEGLFCGGPCNDEVGCPDGYLCDQGQCRLGEGVCECSDTSILEGDGTQCTVVAADGECHGSRECTLDGLSDCSPPDVPECDDPICVGANWTCPATCDGLDCDDGNVCNGLETCDPELGCVPGNPIDCGEGDACTGPPSCDPILGCVLGAPPACDDGLECTLDSCEPEAGCVATPDDSLCDDGDPCTGDVCDLLTGCDNSGPEGGCDDGNPCTADSCVAQACVFEPVIDAPCDDGDACTVDTVCTGAGECSDGQPLACDDDGIDCTIDGCDSDTGCTHVPDPSVCGAPGDGPCAETWLCDPDQGCLATEVSDGNPCDDDGFPCLGAWCQLGQCLPVVGCSDGLDCTLDACTETGCTHTVVADGTACAADPCGGGQCTAGQCVPTGAECGEIQVNLYNAKAQIQPRLAVLADGGVMAVWTSDGEDLDDHGIVAQRHGPDGVQQVLSWVVNQNTNYHQDDPDIAVTTLGRPIIVWVDRDTASPTGWEIRGRFMTVDGTAPDGDEIAINDQNLGNQQMPAVTATTDGGFVAVWRDGYAGNELFARRFDGLGAPVSDDFQINIYETGTQQSPVVTSLPGGGFMAAWDSTYADGSGWGVYGQRFKGDNSQDGPELSLTSTYLNDQMHTALQSFETGGAVAVWRSGQVLQAKPQIMAQRLTPIGLKQGSELSVSTASGFLHERPRVAVSADGWFTLVWASVGEDGDKGTIMARSYDPTGTPAGDPAQVNTVSTGDQRDPDVAMLPGNRPVVVYQSIVPGAPSWDVWLRVLPPLVSESLEQ